MICHLCGCDIPLSDYPGNTTGGTVSYLCGTCFTAIQPGGMRTSAMTNEQLTSARHGEADQEQEGQDRACSGVNPRLRMRRTTDG